MHLTLTWYTPLYYNWNELYCILKMRLLPQDFLFRNLFMNNVHHARQQNLQGIIIGAVHGGH